VELPILGHNMAKSLKCNNCITYSSCHGLRARFVQLKNSFRCDHFGKTITFWIPVSLTHQVDFRDN